MKNNVIPFPVKIAQLDIFEMLAEAAREDLQSEYAAQKAGEDAYRGDAREISLSTFVARLEYQAHKGEPTQNAEGVHVGDLFYGSWDYEQTNVDFFQVVALKGKHTAVIPRIAGDYIGGYAIQGSVRPCRDDFIDDELHTVRTKQLDWVNTSRLLLKHPTANGHMLDHIDDDREIGYSSWY